MSKSKVSKGKDKIQALRSEVSAYNVAKVHESMRSLTQCLSLAANNILSAKDEVKALQTATGADLNASITTFNRIVEAIERQTKLLPGKVERANGKAERLAARASKSEELANKRKARILKLQSQLAKLEALQG